MDIVGLVVALTSGAVGAHLMATRVRRRPSGIYETILSGAMGGLIASQVVERTMSGAITGETDLGSIIVQILGAAAGGAALWVLMDTLRAFLHR